MNDYLSAKNMSTCMDFVFNALDHAQRVSVYCFTCGGQFDTDCDETYCSLSCEDMADAMDEAEEDAV